MSRRSFVLIPTFILLAPSCVLSAQTLHYRTGTGIQGLFQSIHRPESGIPDERLVHSSRKTETAAGIKQKGKVIVPSVVSVSSSDSSEKLTSELLNNIPPDAGILPSKPVPKVPSVSKAPDFYEGIYLNNFIIKSPARWKRLVTKAQEHGLNTLIADVQPVMPREDFIKFAESLGFYLVARIVVFENGLEKTYADTKHLDIIRDTAARSAMAGFREVQLDYIRFSDYTGNLPVSITERYAVISGAIAYIAEPLRQTGIRVGADTFGRISFNNDDIIGQKIEVFSPHLDTLYPMLYPSHFYGDPEKIRNPYQTVYDGTVKTKSRSGAHVKVVPFIQAFKMSHEKSGLSYKQYILKQIEAAYDAGADGFAAWNPGGRYEEFFEALKEYRKKRPRDRSRN